MDTRHPHDIVPTPAVGRNIGKAPKLVELRKRYVPLNDAEVELLTPMNARERGEWLDANIGAMERVARVLEREGEGQLEWIVINVRDGRYGTDASEAPDGKGTDRLAADLKRAGRADLARDLCGAQPCVLEFTS